MRAIIVIISALLCNCAKPDHAAARPDGCETVTVEQRIFPDQIERKSAVYQCKEGCELIEDANDPSLWYSTCE